MANLKKNRVLNFIRSLFTELKFVEFPTRKATMKLSGIVLMISIILGLALFLTDFGLQTLRNLITSFKF